MNYRDQLITDARGIAERAKSAGRDLTTDEQAMIDGKLAELKSLRDGEAKNAHINAFFAQKLDDRTATGYLGLAGTRAKSIADRIASGIREKAIPGNTQIVSDIVLPGIVAEGRPAQTILDLIPARTVPSPVYRTLVQNQRVLAAAAIKPGDVKPTSELGLTTIDGRTRVLAHVAGIDKYTLEDGGQVLAEFIGSEMLWGLNRELERQVLLGEGTGEDMTGLLSTSGIVSQAFTSDILTSVRKSLTVLESNGYTPASVILSPSDWEKLELANVASGALDVRGLPVDSQRRALFGLPVALSTILPAMVGVVLGEGAATIDTLGTIETKWSDSNEDDFVRNRLKIRTEMRANCTVARPAAIVKVATEA